MQHNVNQASSRRIAEKNTGIRRKFRTFQCLPGVILALSSLLMASAPATVAAIDTNPATAAANWTPIMIAPQSVPKVFKGSEEKWHLVYDVLLTNYNPSPSTIKEIQILGRKGGGEFTLLRSLTGDSLCEVFSPLAQKPSGNILANGQAGVLFVNLEFEKPEAVPDELTHRVVFNTALPSGKPWDFDYKAGQVKVDKDPPVRISPPLQGGKWVVAGGYAGKLGHRRALFAIDNHLNSAQTFAIDWMRIDDQNYITHNPGNINDDNTYNQPILAVGDGTIYGVVNRFDDQTGTEPQGMDRVGWAAGNSITLDLGNGSYVLYGHLKRDSMKVKEGDRVRKGQEIARLGNSGNSTGPHLHLHVTSSPSIMNGPAVPYVFDKFEVVGKARDLNAFEEAAQKGTAVTIEESAFKGMHQDELPREGVLLRF